ncbi:Uncharacterised protein [Mycobacteroides abscessus subsp. abscessus]|nr:Uncharacterised protein [Mycobacteroides abscessus subsp. abscessus]
MMMPNIIMAITKPATFDQVKMELRNSPSGMTGSSTLVST